MATVIYVLIIAFLIIFVIMYENDNMIYVKSDIDGEYYLVRNIKDKKHAANTLAIIKKNIFAFANHTQKIIDDNKYKEYKPYIIQFKNKIKNVEIQESSSKSSNTSYTINKGEQIIFCLRSKKLINIFNTNAIHDINLIMYVAIHEISHVACPEYHHTPLFNKIFKFFCDEAVKIGLYDKIDFKYNPMEYCGMMIYESI
jgi:hypothetical protein